VRQSAVNSWGSHHLRRCHARTSTSRLTVPAIRCGVSYVPLAISSRMARTLARLKLESSAARASARPSGENSTRSLRFEEEVDPAEAVERAGAAGKGRMAGVLPTLMIALMSDSFAPATTESLQAPYSVAVGGPKPGIHSPRSPNARQAHGKPQSAPMPLPPPCVFVPVLSASVHWACQRWEEPIPRTTPTESPSFPISSGPFSTLDRK